MIAEDRLAGKVAASDHRGEIEPRVDHGDVAAIGVIANVDPVIDQHPIRRTDVHPGAQRPPADEDAHTKRVCSIGELHRELGHMRDDPAQVADGNLAVHRLAIRDQSRRTGKVQRVIFSAPSRACDRAETVHATAGEFADPAGLQPFVAEARK